LWEQYFLVTYVTRDLETNVSGALPAANPANGEQDAEFPGAQSGRGLGWVGLNKVYS
jgi:hypothetical protein